MAAAIIRPYVRAEVTWILEHHGIFQMVYYADKLGLNKDERNAIAAINGLIVQKNFAEHGIRPPLTRPMPANRFPIFSDGRGNIQPPAFTLPSLASQTAKPDNFSCLTGSAKAV